MRLVPKRWHNETWICSIKGHYLPAAAAERLRDEDRTLGYDVEDGSRFARCLRCDIWVRQQPPAKGAAQYEVIPPLDQLDLPRRGKPLQDAIFMRLIAINRLVHGVLFGLLAIALVVIELKLPAIKDWSRSLADSVQTAVDTAGRGASHAVLSKRLESLADVDVAEVTVLLIMAVVYSVIETVEGIFLWKERRWAEYLTVIATVGFIPIEVRELVERVTVFRVGALVVNVAILVWLVYNKHLFGVRGGLETLEGNIDWDTILSSPLSPEHTPVAH